MLCPMQIASLFFNIAQHYAVVTLQTVFIIIDDTLRCDQIEESKHESVHPCTHAQKVKNCHFIFAISRFQ